MSGQQDSVRIAHDFFDALARGKSESIEELVTADAVLWQNYSDRESLFAERIDNLVKASTVCDSFEYSERHYEEIKGGAFLQHRLIGSVAGRTFSAAIAVRLYIRNGRIFRFEEYLDQGTLEALYRAMR